MVVELSETNWLPRQTEPRSGLPEYQVCTAIATGPRAAPCSSTHTHSHVLSLFRSGLQTSEQLGVMLEDGQRLRVRTAIVTHGGTHTSA